MRGGRNPRLQRKLDRGCDVDRDEFTGEVGSLDTLEPAPEWCKPMRFDRPSLSPAGSHSSWVWALPGGPECDLRCSNFPPMGLGPPPPSRASRIQARFLSGVLP